MGEEIGESGGVEIIEVRVARKAERWDLGGRSVSELLGLGFAILAGLRHKHHLFYFTTVPQDYIKFFLKLISIIFIIVLNLRTL